MNTTEEHRIYLTGNTYNFREEIKAAGGRWDKERKAWHVPASARDAMRRLAAKARTQKRQASHGPPDENQRIIGEGRLIKDNTMALIAWMGRVKTGHLAAKVITRDGRRSFWVEGKGISVTRRFEVPLPLCGLLSQIENA